MVVRDPAVAGQFYPDARAPLIKTLGSMVGAGKKEPCLGAVVPHAGYMYSGFVAGSVFAVMSPRRTYVILGPNHTGIGSAFGIDSSDSWKTPLGEIKINRTLADELKKRSRYLKNDSASHAHEHSIEVELPFLQFTAGDTFTFVPVAVSYASGSVYKEIGGAIAEAVKALKMEKDTVVLASSDMTHYESREAAEKKDAVAIDAILKLDEDRLIKEVSDLEISMCGYAPAAIMIKAAKELGAKRARLVKYATSGDVTGDYSAVVGYAGIIIA